ncbi:hypothetical protein N3K66_008511 [Trichothecium roseum]|uniref:Uncharacterized protein n=1 Tax=Trichothecium roseum TaxID=47278 RepID=A0ACC0US56_9HYPO|nr:hypothetical protein N3K66_008511 [Trichothecium roseum]
MFGYATPHEQQAEEPQQPSDSAAASPPTRTIIHIDNPNNSPSDDATGGAYRELAARILLLPELEGLTSPSPSPPAGPSRSGSSARRKLLVDMCGCGMLVDELESKVRREAAAAATSEVGVGVVMPRVWMVDGEGTVEYATAPPAAGEVGNGDDDNDDYDETADGEADKNGDQNGRGEKEHATANLTAATVVVARSRNGQMPFPDAYFDYTITIAAAPESFTSNSINANNENSSPQDRTAETHRVLRPGGISIYASSPRIAYSAAPFPISTSTSTSTTTSCSSRQTNFCQAGPSPQALPTTIHRALSLPTTPYERTASLPIHYSHTTPQSLYDALRLRFAPALQARNPDANRLFDEGLREFVDDHGEWWWRWGNDHDHDHDDHNDLCAQGGQGEGEGRVESRFGVKMDAAVYICGKYRNFDLSGQNGDDGGAFGFGSPSPPEAGDVERMMASRRQSSSQGTQ